MSKDHDAKSHAWAVLLTAHATLIEKIETALSEAKLPPLAWYDVLRELEKAEGGKLRMHELARRIVLSRSNLTRLADRLEIMGARRTHWDFYRGFSLLFSVTLLLLAALLWQLAGLAKRDPAGARPLLASLFLAYLGFTILCGVYFFFAPAAFSAAGAVCLALAFTSARNT